MSKVIIAVGGTGQEIASACLRLCQMAGMDVPTVYIIDSDQARGKNGLRTRSDELQELGRFFQLERGIPNPVIFLTPLAEGIRTRQITNLKSLFSPAQKTPPEVQDLLALLLSEKQQNTSISDGFHGEPTVGSSAVNDYLLQGKFKEDFFQQIDRMTMPDIPHFIVLAGSTTGGTGPGTLPVLSKKLLEWRENTQPRRSISVSALVQLPWFQPVKMDKIEWSQTPDIDLVKLQRNSACLVRLYDEVLEILSDRLVLLGLPKVIQRASAGPNHQPETRHYLNILSGWMAIELLHDGRTLQKMPPGHLYAYGVDDKNDLLDVLGFYRNEFFVSLRRALLATRILIAFCGGLKSQLGNLKPDLSHPRPIYLFLRSLSEGGSQRRNVKDFLDTFSSLIEQDRYILKWFCDSCEARLIPNDPSGARDPKDLQKIFKISISDTETSFERVGELLAKPQSLEQYFVSYLLEQADSVLDSTDPKATAIKLYRYLRGVLLEKLIRE